MLYCRLCSVVGIAFKSLICTVAFILAVGGGHFAVVWVLRRFKTDDMESEGLKNAGALIGILERALTLALILAGEYTAIAFIFAAKSVARFKGLENRRFAEYYLIGTLSSILITVVIGTIAGYLLKT